MEISHPQGGAKALTAAGRAKPRSVSVKTLSAALEAEADPAKRELVRLVLDWLDAKAVAKRGGFVASGECSAVQCSATSVGAHTKGRL